MGDKTTKLVIVALDYVTLRWTDEDIDPKLALALGTVVNARAEHDLPEIAKATSDMLIYGTGYYRISETETKHIPIQDIRSEAP